MNASLIPVGPLSAGKSRLESELPRGAIEALTLAMLADVTEALRATPELDQVAVLTPDPRAAQAAREAGATVIAEERPGLNPSLDAALAALMAEGATSLLVVLGDVAGARPAEISELFGTLADLGGTGVVLAAARDGGTAALLRCPPDAIPNRFGPDSARAHREAAEALALPFRELSLPSLRIDLDRPEDLAEARRFTEGGRRTRTLLAKLGSAA